MKKFISLLLVLVLALSLVACGGSNNEQPAPTEGNTPAATEAPADEKVEATEAPAEETEAPAASVDTFVFNYNGTDIAMNVNAADILAALGEPRSYTEETSCAFTGLDKTFYFGSFYLQTYPQGEDDFIYSLWLVDDSLVTPEGIYIGATQAEVESAYGTEGFNGSNAYIMVAGECKLTVILKDGVVSSIQYDAVLE